MPTGVRIPATTHALERLTLANGLRVVLAPDRSAPVVGVCVNYDVGIRSEPPGRTGFAHLFEHLMFQGSATLQKLEHFRYVQASGGTFNGSTHLDYTNYYEALPSNALERALFLEADRMTAPRITPETLANQVSVVQEEIRVNVLNRPYGDFPWLTLPPVMFDSFANSHNGYGDFVDLESATVADAEDFFTRYYTPGNAVLCVGGDLDLDDATRWIEQYFGPIAKRRTPKRPSLAEPDLDGPRHAVVRDRLAPTPAVAMAWRTPDPLGDLDAYLPLVVLIELLTEGDASRLRQRLMQRERLATSLSGYLGMMGDPFDARDPNVVLLEAHHQPEVSAERLCATVAEEIERVATDGPEPGELERVQARLAAQMMRSVDSVLGRTLAMTTYEQQRGRAELVGELPALLAAVTADQIRAAAAAMHPNRRAVLELVPEGSS